jgi:hypothetical protein
MAAEGETMGKVDECCHNVAMDADCDRCPREGRLVLTMNVLTGYMSQWLLPHREKSAAPEQPDATTAE